MDLQSRLKYRLREADQIRGYAKLSYLSAGFIREHAIVEIERLMLYLFDQIEIVPVDVFVSFKSPCTQYFRVRGRDIFKANYVTKVFLSVNENEVEGEVHGDQGDGRRYTTEKLGSPGSYEVLVNLSKIFNIPEN